MTTDAELEELIAFHGYTTNGYTTYDKCQEQKSGRCKYCRTCDALTEYKELRKDYREVMSYMLGGVITLQEMRQIIDNAIERESTTTKEAGE